MLYVRSYRNLQALCEPPPWSVLRLTGSAATVELPGTADEPGSRVFWFGGGVNLGKCNKGLDRERCTFPPACSSG
jgi:hypothetical protein